MGVHRHKTTGRYVAQRWDGERRRNVQVGTYASEQEAWDALGKSKVEQTLSLITVAEWRTRWLTTPEWRASTRAHNTERTRRFAATHGDKRLTEIDRRIARAWIAKRPSEHGCLSAMFGAALYADSEGGDRLLADNPFAKLVKKKIARRDIAADWLTEADIADLERHARKVHGPELGDTLACMIRFAAETGVRPGELYVLELDDLDTAAGVLHVRRSFSSQPASMAAPKNGEQRAVVLSQRAAEVAQEALGYGRGEITPTPVLTPQGRPVRGDEFWLPRGTPRIFSTTSGAQWRQPQLSIHWAPVRRSAGRDGMAFYELRHYCATRLIELGLRDDEVAVQLGHTDGGKLVRETYGHPNNRRARDAIRAALDRKDAA